MKKTLIALIALTGVSFGADSPLTLFDQWTFDSSLESTNNRTFSTQSVNITYSNGALSLGLSHNSSCGIHLDDSNSLGLTGGNWAIQLTLQLGTTQTGSSANVLACLNNASDGTQLAVSNSTDGSVYGFASAPGFGGWADGTRTDIKASDNLVTLTILNYEGVTYFAQGTTWATFGSGDSKTDGIDIGDDTLGKLTLGFGQNGSNGMQQQTIIVDDISVYTFNAETSTLSSVKAALVPEPATATLSLLALAGLAARRRRK